MEYSRWTAEKILDGRKRELPNDKEVKPHYQTIQWDKVAGDAKERYRQTVINMFNILRRNNLSVAVCVGRVGASAPSPNKE